MGINRIRWEHPTTLPPHVHDDAEQCVIVTEGAISFTIGGETSTLGEGDVAVVPRGVLHSGESISGGGGLYRGLYTATDREPSRLLGRIIS